LDFDIAFFFSCVPPFTSLRPRCRILLDDVKGQREKFGVRWCCRLKCNVEKILA